MDHHHMYTSEISILLTFSSSSRNRVDYKYCSNVKKPMQWINKGLHIVYLLISPSSFLTSYLSVIWFMFLFQSLVYCIVCVFNLYCFRDEKQDPNKSFCHINFLLHETKSISFDMLRNRWPVTCFYTSCL